MMTTIAAANTAEASGRLKSSPPLATGLSRKSPTVAPSGRVRMNAAQNKAMRLALVAALYFATGINRVALFWAAFILTRPLGATVGDFLDKPVAKGGLAVSRPIASLVLAAVIVLLILLLPQRAGRHGERVAQAT